jgi:hypothetical protein
MKVKKFFKKMFSEQADVDYFPPESQPLNPSTADSGNSESESGLVSLEEQRRSSAREGGGTDVASPVSDTTTDHSPGLTDGYEQWSQTFEAFHSAIMHTIVYFLIGVIGYSYLLNTKWDVIDSLYFSVVIFTTGAFEFNTSSKCSSACWVRLPLNQKSHLSSRHFHSRIW